MIEKVSKEQIKMLFQKSLESQGWKFRANINVNYDSNGKRFSYRLKPKSNEEIKEDLLQSLGRCNLEVLVTETYDLYGNLLQHMRTVYIKE